MRIVAIGDPHGNIDKLKKVPIKEAELILLTGDLGKADKARKRFFENQKRKQRGLEELEEDKKHQKAVHMEIHNSTLKVLKYASKFAPVYTIQGNVGIPAKAELKEERKKFGLKLPATKEAIDKIGKVKIMKNNLRIINGIKIGFLEFFTDISWVKEFKPGNYTKSMKRAAKQTAKARKILKKFSKVDILVCHQPPYGYLDKVNFPGVPDSWKGKHAGSKAILDYIKKYQPKYVFCGHIHEGEGMKKINKTEVYNLGVCGYKKVDL